MRDYLSPAKRYVSRVMTYPGSLGAFVVKRKSLSFAIAASFVVITTIGFVATKGIMQGSKIYQSSVSSSDGSSIHTIVTTDNLPEPSTQPPESDARTTTSSADNSNGPSVTVNNEKINIPDNGSVSKTIHSDNGTTKVDISVNSNSTTSSNSNSSSNVTVNTNTSSRTVTHSQ